MVFIPIDWRAANNVLWGWNRRELACGGVLSINVETWTCGLREFIVFQVGEEALRVLQRCIFETIKGLNVFDALLTLYLKD